jgi:hypothetical protein
LFTIFAQKGKSTAFGHQEQKDWKIRQWKIRQQAENPSVENPSASGKSVSGKSVSNPENPSVKQKIILFAMKEKFIFILII